MSFPCALEVEPDATPPKSKAAKGKKNKGKQKVVRTNLQGKGSSKDAGLLKPAWGPTKPTCQNVKRAADKRLQRACSQSQG
jgi:hypothetical protein